MANLPPWAARLAEIYYSGTVVVFTVHGNVHDLVSCPGQEDLPLNAFLEKVMFGQRDIVLRYDRGGGISFRSAEEQRDFRNALSGYDSFHETRYSQSLPRNPDGVLNLIDNYLRLRIHDGKKIALILDFAETIAPAGDTTNLTPEDRNAVVILQRWAHNAQFLKSDVTIVLVTESLTELNQNIVQHPGVSSVAIPLPDEAERLEFLERLLAKTPLRTGEDSPTIPVLANLTAGLKRIQLQALTSQAIQGGAPLSIAELSRRKKHLIEAESGGMLEFVAPKWNLSMVAGLGAAKEKLVDAVSAIRLGHANVLPMGYVLCGPVGTGKTFLANCFAGEVGIPAVMLKNFRSMWQGQTEGNLERVLGLLKAMSPIVVIVDEADAQLGNRSSSGDSGVSERVFAQIAQFMGNTELRGKVIWFLLTCRPDLLPVDLKRQGRAEEHLALFYPETEEDRLAIFRVMQKKTGAVFADREAAEKEFLRQPDFLSGADVEAILVRAKMKALLQGRAAPDLEDLKAIVSDFIPASDPAEIELQNLVAALECTSRKLLPTRYQDLERGELQQRLLTLQSR